jgi:hypothetical protein
MHRQSNDLLSNEVYGRESKTMPTIQLANPLKLAGVETVPEQIGPGKRQCRREGSSTGMPLETCLACWQQLRLLISGRPTLAQKWRGIVRFSDS